MIIPITILFSEIIKENQFKIESLFVLGAVLIVTVLSLVWLKRMQLETTINSEEIAIKYRALFTKKRFRFSEINCAEVITYSPFMDYGGWGIKYSFKRGWCYNVSGDKGILIKLNNGKMVLIGTQQPDTAKLFLESVGMLCNNR